MLFAKDHHDGCWLSDVSTLNIYLTYKERVLVHGERDQLEIRRACVGTFSRQLQNSRGILKHKFLPSQLWELVHGFPHFDSGRPLGGEYIVGVKGREKRIICSKHYLILIHKSHQVIQSRFAVCDVVII